MEAENQLELKKLRDLEDEMKHKRLQSRRSNRIERYIMGNMVYDKRYANDSIRILNIRYAVLK
jgi:hypothetical protein